jgi:hypothetical protein
MKLLLWTLKEIDFELLKGMHFLKTPLQITCLFFLLRIGA